MQPCIKGMLLIAAMLGTAKSYSTTNLAGPVRTPAVRVHRVQNPAAWRWRRGLADRLQRQLKSSGNGCSHVSMTESGSRVPRLPDLLQGLLGRGGGGGWGGERGVQRASLKADLAAAVELNQGREARERVEGILEALIALQGPVESRNKLQGTWRLIWSSQTADSFPLAKVMHLLAYALAFMHTPWHSCVLGGSSERIR